MYLLNFGHLVVCANLLCFQQGDCVVSNVLTLDLTQYEDPHAHEEDERVALLNVR